MVAVTSEGDHVVSASSDCTLKVWEVVRIGKRWSLRETHILKGHEGEVTGVAVADATRRIVSASMDGSVRLWDLDTGEPLQTLLGHDAAVLTVVTTPDGRTAISSAKNGSMLVWDLAKGEKVRDLKGHTDKT